MVDIIYKYFPRLKDRQKEQIEALYLLYEDWNSKINVISRKDIENLYERHVLHSLSIAKWLSFTPGSQIIDVGCGGGFPGLPLAILFPHVDFHMVDSIRKKLKVIDEVSSAIGLENIRTTHSRIEDIHGKYDFAITRAVAQMPMLVSWVRKNIKEDQQNATPNGLIALKGGALDAELKTLKKREYMEITPLSKFYEEEFFKEKFLVYIQL